VKVHLILAFILASVIAIFRTIFFPNLQIIAFAPFLALFFLNNNFLTSLWISIFAGIIMDLLSTATFGIHALNYCLAATVVFRYKRFFSDSSINLTIYTIILSLAISVIEIVLNAFLYRSINLSFLWIITDIFLMPILDGIYALIFFAVPLKINKIIQYSLFRYIKTKRRRRRR
jgi:rod shape-determining protein MreD